MIDLSQPPVLRPDNAAALVHVGRTLPSRHDREEDNTPWNRLGFQEGIVAIPSSLGDNPFTNTSFTMEEVVWAHYAIMKVFLATNADATTESLEALQSRAGWQELFGDSHEHPPTLFDLLAKTCLRRQNAEQMEAEVLRNLATDNKWSEETVATQVARAQGWFCHVARFFGDSSVRSEPMSNPHARIFLHALWEIDQSLGIGG